MKVIKIACLECAQRIEVKETWIGRTINCPRCGSHVTVRAPSEEEEDLSREATPDTSADALESVESWTSFPPAPVSPLPAISPAASPAPEPVRGSEDKPLVHRPPSNATLPAAQAPKPPDAFESDRPLPAKRLTVGVGNLLAAVPVLIGGAYFVAMCQFGESPQAVWKRLAAAKAAFLRSPVEVPQIDAEVLAPVSTPYAVNAKPVVTVRETPPVSAARAVVPPAMTPAPAAMAVAAPTVAPMPATAKDSQENTHFDLPPMPAPGTGFFAVPAGQGSTPVESAPTVSPAANPRKNNTSYDLPTPTEAPPGKPNFFGVPRN